MAQREAVFPPVGALSTKPMVYFAAVRSNYLLFVSESRAAGRESILEEDLELN